MSEEIKERLLAEMQANLAELRAEYVAERDAKDALIASLTAERDALDRHLQSLTPGGSEYVNNPERCVAFVGEVRKGQLSAIIERTRELTAARAEVERLRGAAKPFIEIADLYDESEPDDHLLLTDQGEPHTWLRLGQCRALRAALTPAEEGERG